MKKHSLFFSVSVGLLLKLSIALPTASAQMPSATPELQCAIRDDGSSLCINDRVIDYENNTGFIREIYSNQTAVVAYDTGEVYMMDLQYLYREVQCLWGFCISDRIQQITNGAIGTLESVYENGEAEVRMDYDRGQIYLMALNELRPVNQTPVIIDRRYPYPRGYPDVIIIRPYPFPNCPNVWPHSWPRGYPYRYPTYRSRVIYGCHPVRPTHHGHHQIPHYPYGNGRVYHRHDPIPGGGRAGPRPYPRGQERPSYPTPRRPGRGPMHPAPGPSRPMPGPTRPTEPSRPMPGPTRPAPSRPSEPSRPAPSRPSEPSRPAPSRPSEPSRPAPSRPSEPSRPAPSRPSEPSRPSPSRPSEPSRPAPSRPAPSRPSEPSRPAPSRPSPSRPSEPSRPAPSRPAPSRPSEPSRPAPSRPAPSRPGPRSIIEIPYQSPALNNR